MTPPGAAPSYPIDPRSRGVFLYRWAVFLLAAFFVLRQIVFAADYSDPGGPFRFLTIWALLLSFLSASRMMAIVEGRTSRRWDPLVEVTAVVNALVVILYWRLWLQDPALVNSGPPLPWWLEYYLHGLGPLLQWIDALFLYGAFRRPIWAVPALLGLTALYVVWIEVFVERANETPVGLVTDGLPYPFLNSMELSERLTFYATTAVSGVALLAAFWVVAAVIRFLRRGGRQGLPDRSDSGA